MVLLDLPDVVPATRGEGRGRRGARRERREARGERREATDGRQQVWRGGRRRGHARHQRPARRGWCIGVVYRARRPACACARPLPDRAHRLFDVLTSSKKACMKADCPAPPAPPPPAPPPPSEPPRGAGPELDIPRRDGGAGADAAQLPRRRAKSGWGVGRWTGADGSARDGRGGDDDDDSGRGDTHTEARDEIATTRGAQCGGRWACEHLGRGGRLHREAIRARGASDRPRRCARAPTPPPPWVHACCVWARV